MTNGLTSQRANNSQIVSVMLSSLDHQFKQSSFIFDKTPFKNIPCFSQNFYNSFFLIHAQHIFGLLALLMNLFEQHRNIYINYKSLISTNTTITHTHDLLIPKYILCHLCTNFTQPPLEWIFTPLIQSMASRNSAIQQTTNIVLQM